MQAPAQKCEISSVLPFTPRSLRRPALLRFVGALDAFTVGEARSRIDALVEEAPKQIVVDLAGLTLLDSVGVHVLVTLYKRMKTQGCTVSIVNAHDQPLAVLDVLKLKAVFGVVGA